MPIEKSYQQQIKEIRKKRDREIVRRHNAGELIQDIAASMDMTRQRVGQIIAANTKPAEA